MPGAMKVAFKFAGEFPKIEFGFLRSEPTLRKKGQQETEIF